MAGAAGTPRAFEFLTVRSGRDITLDGYTVRFAPVLLRGHDPCEHEQDTYSVVKVTLAKQRAKSSVGTDAFDSETDNWLRFDGQL